MKTISFKYDQGVFDITFDNYFSSDGDIILEGKMSAKDFYDVASDGPYNRGDTLDIRKYKKLTHEQHDLLFIFDDVTIKIINRLVDNNENIEIKLSMPKTIHNKLITHILGENFPKDFN